jgi:hypothetical protein
MPLLYSQPFVKDASAFLKGVVDTEDATPRSPRLISKVSILGNVEKLHFILPDLSIPKTYKSGRDQEGNQ